LKKDKEYLQSGTRLVWVIYPEEQTVEIFRPVEPRWQTLTLDDTLAAEDVLPGFELAVRDIFPEVG